MVETQKKFYLYDRWYECQGEKNGKLIYFSIPKNASKRIKIELNSKTNEMTLFYFKDKKVIRKIMVTDITQRDIKLHYSDEVCDLLEIGDNKYDNLAVEVFASIKDDSTSHDYQIMFTKKDEESKFAWVDPIFPINEKIDMNEVECSSDKVNDFIEFACHFPIDIRKLRNFISQQKSEKKKVELSEIKEIVIPQEITVYDRVYHLVKVSENKIFLTNTQEGIRNLEIKYDPISLVLEGISIKMKDKNKTERVIKIKPNNLDGVTVKYYTKIKETVLINNRKIDGVKVRSNMIFDNNNKVQVSISISNEEEEFYLLEHPLIRNNYSDGDGNLYTVRNSGYNIYYGIASFAPGIINGVKEKVFQKTKIEE